ncbi:hypothetical protein CVT26_000748 [Gymnopilus dilepis]|uniref:Uncharacterized protein n=1 Tax=Gymnopilus dilepis TaxID=231916 RepID=A0A409Y2K8_9AGAR|nr:hypothetical protein CVT26_000748 [Gymnopilus dilepis]
MQNSTKIIDDQDPSVLYSPGWRRKGTPNFEFDNTTSKANTPGLTATLNFTGVGIKVFGTIAADGVGNAPKSSYAVDALPVQGFTGTQQSDTQYRVLFFQSRPLLPGSHTLIVTNIGKNASLFLDYFEVDEGYPTPTTTTVTVSAISWSSGVASVQSSTINVLEANSTPHILVVVTALLGGFLVLSLFYLAVLHFRRRRRAIASIGTGTDTQPTGNRQAIQMKALPVQLANGTPAIHKEGGSFLPSQSPRRYLSSKVDSHSKHINATSPRCVSVSTSNTSGDTDVTESMSEDDSIVNYPLINIAPVSAQAGMASKLQTRLDTVES